jgi:hypothetical protein
MVHRALWPLVVASGLSDEQMMTEAIKHAVDNKWVARCEWVVVVSGTQGIRGSFDAHLLYQRFYENLFLISRTEPTVIFQDLPIL